MHTYETLLDTITPRSGATRDISNPATDEFIGRAPLHSLDDLEHAITTATAAQPAWEALGHAKRSELLLRAADAVDRSAEALAQLISREQGKPLNGLGSRYEAGGCAAWLRSAATADLEPEVIIDDGTTYAELHYKAVGVVGAIGPWNWPALIATWQIGPSLRMGNTIVMKPSEYTPLSVLALAEIINQELPEGVLTIISGDRQVGSRLSSHPAFGKIMFTGSTTTGKAIVRASADNLPRLTMELGGNDPGIVLPDVDPAAIAEDLFWGAFANTGQTCAALKRLYVHEDVYDAVCQAVIDVAASIPMGPGTDEKNLLGPLTNTQQWNIVNDLVEDARRSGARIRLGGNPDTSAPGNFYPATIVTDIDAGNRLVTEEQFGPVLPIIRYNDLNDAISQANSLDVGLGASVWSADRDKARTVAARIQAGTVWINSHGGLHPMVPFGGVKHSGYGLEFGIEGLKSLGAPQIITG